MAKVVVLLVVFAALPMVEMGNGYCFLADIQPCIPAIKATGPRQAPTAACCDSISKTSQVCLCQAVSGPETPRAGLSVGKALVLPLECGINVPSGTTCAKFFLVVFDLVFA
ncbi:tapetum-specific protein A9 [Selaginella moellendorffii]|uniref:tapetum-specific protein A9 n=1 Tax=Selaginella moellendorffii TaxID=88036 RepID=UPI000D1C69CC|nr:tapetum-specific protein A9 [Selaginella moellendorffii]|eukprot:XP_024533165.1 tapetum-specific protein A9 [Selaginella moellendorffii]